VAQAGPALAALFANLTPLFAGLMQGALLGQWPQAYHLMAFGLIVGGIAMSSLRR
jgi:drug/metabolite transporter (DMT)-like permease